MKVMPMPTTDKGGRGVEHDIAPANIEAVKQIKVLGSGRRRHETSAKLIENAAAAKGMAGI